MHIGEIFGKGVLDKNAINVGKVTDADLNLETWTVNHLIIKTGFTKKVKVGFDKIDKIGDKVILKVTKDELEK